MDAPVLTHLVLSTTDWEAPQFGTRQQIAQRLAARGHTVVFVEVPRALHSLVSNPAGTLRAVPRMGRLRRVAPRLHVYTPWPVLPVYYHPVSQAVNQRLFYRDLRRMLARLGARPDVVWTYWPHMAYPIRRLGARLSVYHCVDNFSAAGYPFTAPETIRRMEDAQCRVVDLILARNEAMAEERRALNRHTYLLPGGVDTALFDPERDHPEPPEMAGVPRPRVGMVGTLGDWVDTALLAHAARRLPGVSFVLAGPVRRHRADVGRLRGCPNVHLLPACPHAAVPARLAHLDVCLIPYRIVPYTRSCAPLKLYEYLAMGKPVVATDLPYVRRERAHLWVAPTPEAFVAGIEQALQEAPTAPARARRRTVARAYDWECQVDRIEALLASRWEAGP